MAVHYDDQREMIRLRLKLCRAGFAGIYKNDLVDARVYDDAELFEPQAVEEIIKDLEAELIAIDILEEQDKEAIIQRKINDFNDLIDETDKLEIDVDNKIEPYNNRISVIEKERDMKVSGLKRQISVHRDFLLRNCPHITTKMTTKSTEGDYLNTGTHSKIWNCLYCGKEISRVDTSTGYA